MGKVRRFSTDGETNCEDRAGKGEVFCVRRSLR